MRDQPASIKLLFKGHYVYNHTEIILDLDIIWVCGSEELIKCVVLCFILYD